jgi:hypothetical protein
MCLLINSAWCEHAAHMQRKRGEARKRLLAHRVTAVLAANTSCPAATTRQVPRRFAHADRTQRDARWQC